MSLRAHLNLQLRTPLSQNNLHSIKGLVAPFVLFSCISNLAILVSPIYMMQILDRVVPSGNMGTLYLLLSVALGVLLLQAIVEYFRDISLKGLSIWSEKNAMLQALSFDAQQRQNAIDFSYPYSYGSEAMRHDFGLAEPFAVNGA